MESSSVWNFSFLSFSLAAQTSSVKLGYMLGDLLLPKLYEVSGGLSLGYWIGVIISSICITVTIQFYKIDKQHNRLFANNDQVDLSQIKNFPLLFWLLAICLGIYQGTYNTFNSIASKMLQVRFGFDLISASYILV